MHRLEKLSEFLGCLAGDGYIATNSNKVGLVMHPTLDIHYLLKYMSPIILELFENVNLKFKVRQRAARLFFNSKSLVDRL